MGPDSAPWCLDVEPADAACEAFPFAFCSAFESNRSFVGDQNEGSCTVDADCVTPCEAAKPASSSALGALCNPVTSLCECKASVFAGGDFLPADAGQFNRHVQVRARHCTDGGSDATCCVGGDDTYGTEARFCTEVNTAQSYASVIDDPNGDTVVASLDLSGGGAATSCDFVGLPGTTSPAPFALFGAGSRTEITPSAPTPQLPVGVEVLLEHPVP